MDYFTFRETVKTGGVLGVQGNGFIGLLIRVLTGQSFQHVAMTYWTKEDNLMRLKVAEFIEGVGFQIMYASEWFEDRQKKGHIVFYGKPPKEVIKNSLRVKVEIFKLRDSDKEIEKNYNYWELPLVWIANIFNMDTSRLGGICSSFVGKIYNLCGVSRYFHVPGDILTMCNGIEKVSYDGS